MVFGVSEPDRAVWIGMAETDLQRKKEKNLTILETLVVLGYDGAPSICHLRQPGWTVFQPSQGTQHVQDESALRVDGIEGRGNRFG